MKTRTVRAFDVSEIQQGNFALGIDHDNAARETDALLARMSLQQKVNEIRGHGPSPAESLWYAGGDAALGIAAWKMVRWTARSPRGHRDCFPGRDGARGHV